MRISLIAFVFFTVSWLSGCVSGENNNLLQSVAAPEPFTVGAISKQKDQSTEQNRLFYGKPETSEQAQASSSIFASQPEVVAPEVVAPEIRPRNKKTYLINGLASSVESIGYGFTNLSKKIPGSVLHNYASFVESSTIIRSKVTRELKAAYQNDPDVEINLIGISFGANIVTLIAADLDRARVPVNYLVTMEGPAMVPITDNVKIADNFSCTNLDCFRTKSRLAWGNKKTRYSAFKIKSSHIPLANHGDVHRRILSQINRPLPPLIAVQ